MALVRSCETEKNLRLHCRIVLFILKFHDLIFTGLFTHLLGPESLVHVGVLQEPGHGEKVGSCVHHDEEERPRQVEAGNVGIILHN